MSRTGGRPTGTVLLVEDDADLSSIIADLLVGAGHTVAHTRRGADALRLAIQSHPAVIVLDLGLPDTTGAALLEQLKTHPAARSIPVLAVSWRPLTPDDPLATRADGVLAKPFDFNDLLAAVARASAARCARPVTGSHGA